MELPARKMEELDQLLQRIRQLLQYGNEWDAETRPVLRSLAPPNAVITPSAEAQEQTPSQLQGWFSRVEDTLTRRVQGMRKSLAWQEGRLRSIEERIGGAGK